MTAVQKWRRAMKTLQLAKNNMHAVIEECAGDSDEDKDWLTRRTQIGEAFEKYREAHMKLKAIEIDMNKGCKEVPICEPG